MLCLHYIIVNINILYILNKYVIFTLYYCKYKYIIYYIILIYYIY